MANEQELRKIAVDTIDASKDELLALSHDIFQYAELAFEEVRSSKRLRDFLEKYGFEIKEIEEMPTAFVAEIGRGSPVIAFMAEYDALPEMGHACGHNICCCSSRSRFGREFSDR